MDSNDSLEEMLDEVEDDYVEEGESNEDVEEIEDDYTEPIVATNRMKEIKDKRIDDVTEDALPKLKKKKPVSRKKKMPIEDSNKIRETVRRIFFNALAPLYKKKTAERAELFESTIYEYFIVRPMRPLRTIELKTEEVSGPCFDEDQSEDLRRGWQKYKYFAYELLPSFASHDLKELMMQITRGEIFWDDPIFKSLCLTIDKEDLASNKKIVVDEGNYTCTDPKCRSKRITTIALQLRSADEPMSIFATCTMCSTTWQVYN
jgi:DNA-directed RNA polymerase subunit M/transcription elongation factor TFIIS